MLAGKQGCGEEAEDGRKWSFLREVTVVVDHSPIHTRHKQHGAKGGLNGTEELRLRKQRYVCKGRFLMADHL